MPGSAKRVYSDYQHNRNNRYAVTKPTAVSVKNTSNSLMMDIQLSETFWSFNDGPQMVLTSVLKKCVLRVSKA
jgi:hypothetical protein